MLNAPARTVHRARKLRKQMSLPEGLLWRELKKRPQGLKFRKQHPAGYYVLDFFCAEANLCVEVDGEAHDRGDQPEFDAKRDDWLRLHAIETLRVMAKDVLSNLEGVLVQIVETALQRIPPRNGEVAAGTADGGAELQTDGSAEPLPLRRFATPPRAGEGL